MEFLKNHVFSALILNLLSKFPHPTRISFKFAGDNAKNILRKRKKYFIQSIVCTKTKENEFFGQKEKIMCLSNARVQPV